jgi:outer membrane protein OmpA-like peptidoglycan-associated protein
MGKAWLIVLAAALWPAAAFAQALEVSWVGQGKSGQPPKVRVLARAPALGVTLRLERDDGQRLELALGDLTGDGAREVPLDGPVGRHRYAGEVSCVVDGKPATVAVAFETYVAGPIALAIPDPRLEDLAAGRMAIRTELREGTAQILLVPAAAGAPPIAHAQPFAQHDPALPLTLVFPPAPRITEIGRVEIRVTDPTGAYETKTFSPWRVTIPHEEVNFATNQAAIAPPEAPKLENSLGLITEVLRRNPGVAPTLFIAGHTDTVGAAAYNVTLSRKRAAAIAAWFRKHGLPLAIAYEGFGEHAPRVPTPDHTDEPKNRRVDYILAVDEPVLPATDFRPVWKRLP